MAEKIIVTLTTWSKRISNIPIVLDTIFEQTLLPDLVVLNLSFDEVVPKNVQQFIENHKIEVNRVEDTKVYKKLIPTLKKYPEDIIIAIDDDWLYPKGMIEDFINVHRKYPNNPISGNRVIIEGMQCHCGCASLTKSRFFGDYLNQIDSELIMNCPSDDIVYTVLSLKAGYPYVRTSGLYFDNMESYNSVDSYSDNSQWIRSVLGSYDYLNTRFFIEDENVISKYIKDELISNLLNDIIDNNIKEKEQLAADGVRKSVRYKLGSFILKPFKFIQSLIK